MDVCVVCHRGITDIEDIMDKKKTERKKEKHARTKKKWPSGLRRRSAVIDLLRVRGSNPAGGMDICLVLSVVR
jgi:hypothetical protein